MFARPSGHLEVPLSDKALQAARDILNILIGAFGPWGTVVLIGVGLLGMFLFRVYKDRRADKAIDRALAEKERTIQRLANQERTWRRVLLTENLKLDKAEADSILALEGEYDTPEASRRALEAKKKKPK